MLSRGSGVMDRCLPTPPPAPAPSSKSTSARSSPTGACSRRKRRRRPARESSRPTPTAWGPRRSRSALLTAGCRQFYVAILDEGIALREALGPEPDIAVFNGPLPGCAGEFVAARLIPVLNTPGQLEIWRDLPQPSPALVHVDTGFNRLGLSGTEFAAGDSVPRRGRAFWVWSAISPAPIRPTMR